MVHIGVEAMVIGGITFYLTHQVNTVKATTLKLEQRVAHLEQVVEQMTRFISGVMSGMPLPLQRPTPEPSTASMKGPTLPPAPPQPSGPTMKIIPPPAKHTPEESEEEEEEEVDDDEAQAEIEAIQSARKSSKSEKNARRRVRRNGA